jgi:hypothetical protein
MSTRNTRKNSLKRKNSEKMLFGKQNYLLMAVGFSLLVIGFLIMRIENEINGFFSLFIAPWVIFAGFVTFGLGILKKNPALEEITE